MTLHSKRRFITLGTYLGLALILKFVLADIALADEVPDAIRILALLPIFGVGIFYIFSGTTEIIEETTDVLRDRTKLAGGFLQSFGTAFPDMVIGVVAAIMSLSLQSVDYTRAVNLAIIAAATTFGSNIYNILHATWCIFRQNLANQTDRAISMFPLLRFGGTVRPFREHAVKPTRKEINASINVLGALTILTAIVAISMVLFGRVRVNPAGMEGDLYQLVKVAGVGILILCAFILYHFRNSERAESIEPEVVREERYYEQLPTSRIWVDLLCSGIAILFVAESLVRGMEVISLLTNLPFVLAGIAAGIIGCMGEIIVVHDFTVHPKGRIGDAVVGVAMDNIVTTLGAAIVAIIGGLFLGGNSLVLIFVVILAANGMLMQQIARLKDYVPVAR